MGPRTDCRQLVQHSRAGVSGVESTIDDDRRKLGADEEKYDIVDSFCYDLGLMLNTGCSSNSKSKVCMEEIQEGSCLLNFQSAIFDDEEPSVHDMHLKLLVVREMGYEGKVGVQY